MVDGVASRRTLATIKHTQSTLKNTEQYSLLCVHTQQETYQEFV